MAREEQAPAQGGEENRRSWVDRFWKFLEGGFLERLFTRRNMAWIVAVCLFFLAQIYNNYNGLRKIQRISDQKTKLTELRMAHVTISTKLMSERRLSAIEDRVKEEELGIEIPKTSPIVIKK